MLHRTRFTTELRELPPQDGWARHEGTGRACLVCPCGLNTGWLPFHEADQIRMTHGTPAEQPAHGQTSQPTNDPGTIKIHVALAPPDGTALRDFLRWAIRRGW